jgi:hypothetical protein
MTGLAPWQQVLHVELRGRNLDDSFSGIQYQKGAMFLRRLEAVFGRERFDRFLRGYFDAHAFRSLTTGDFVAWLTRELLASDPARAAQIDVDLWLEKPGLPPDAARDVSPLLVHVAHERDRFVAGATPEALDTKGWVTQEWQRFIQTMPDDLPVARLAELDRAFGFTRTRNSEVLCDWLVLAIRRQYHAVDARLEEFLMNVGRTKYVRRLYAELAKTPEGLARARAIYARARPRYHAATRGSIDRVVEAGAR